MIRELVSHCCFENPGAGRPVACHGRVLLARCAFAAEVTASAEFWHPEAVQCKKGAGGKMTSKDATDLLCVSARSTTIHKATWRFGPGTARIFERIFRRVASTLSTQ